MSLTEVASIVTLLKHLLDVVFEWSRALIATIGTSSLNTILTDVETLLKCVAICLGGFWTYYLYVRGRVAKPRLRLEIAFESLNAASGRTCLIRVEAQNIGTSKIAIQRAGTAAVIEFLSDSDTARWVAEWESAAALDVFVRHGWIEPSETIFDEILVPESLIANKPGRIRLRVVSSKTEWNYTRIIKLQEEQRDESR